MFPCDKNNEFGGCCCCNCTNRKIVYRHPGNEWVGRGSISEVFGYVCVAIKDNYIFFENEKQHGICELHNLKV